MTLTRKKHLVPAHVSKALKASNLVDEYKSRPAYQQNDYIGWIQRAKRPETKQKRLQQMIEELKKGGVYMGIKHNK